MCEGGRDSPNVRETCGGHRDEIFFRNPGVPVLPKYLQCTLIILHLAKRELVEDGIVIRIDKDARRYPRLALAHTQVLSERRVEGRVYICVRVPLVQTSHHWQHGQIGSAWHDKENEQVHTADG